MSARVTLHQYADMAWTGLSRLTHSSTTAVKAEAEALVVAHLEKIEERWNTMDADDIDEALEGLMVLIIRFLRNRRIPLQ